MSYGPLFDKYKQNGQDQLITYDINPLSTDFEESRKKPPVSPKTNAATIFSNDLEIANYLNLGRMDRNPFNRQTLILKQDHIVPNEVLEDNIVDEIKHRYKKEIVKIRPHSEADLGDKFDNIQLQNKKLNQIQAKLQDTFQPVRNPRHEALLLKELLQLSIKKEKIEKALAATGYQNSMNAINWLMRHAKDPFMNQDPKIATREYALVLCPVGRLANQINTFIELSKKKCNNDVIFNNFLPYMKLTSFFKLPDSSTPSLHKAFDLLFKLQSQTEVDNKTDQVIRKATISEINIDLHASSQMLLLYPDIESEGSLKNLVNSFSKLASKLTHVDNQIQPYPKQLHLTLAYNFSLDHKRTLEELANENIGFNSAADWEMRLYSRDVRADSKFTYRVTSSYKSKAYGELSLKENDFIYASSVTTKDNFIKGVSLSHGESGFFPNKNVERANESDTWVLHKTNICVSQSVIPLNKEQIYPTPKTKSGSEKYQINSYTEKKSSTSNSNKIKSDNSYMQMRFDINPDRSLQISGLLRFFFARHGERIDLTFGASWLEQAFDKQGKYRRTNLNMPGNLPIRNSKRDFVGDSPLTEIGKFQARLTGEALGNESYKLHYCYSSPALRCIQTAHQILTAQGLENQVKIRIEPSLFEFLGWYERGIPKFLSIDALIDFGFNIDSHYKPLLSLDRLQNDENYTDYYQRSFNISKYLASMHQKEGANVLSVGHAGTLEVCTRQLSGGPLRTYSEFNQTIRKVPYLGICLLKKEAASLKFEIQPSIIPPIGHTANFNFDAASLTALHPAKSSNPSDKLNLK